ncbi:MAG: TonB-dependent receptor domain-containing protein [Vicinamibacteria bacterium]
MRRAVFLGLAASLVLSGLASAQTGDASLRGYVRDESGAILPGATITATSSAIMAPRNVVSDSAGYYRILNLPPGTYVLTADLSGFSDFRQEGIVLRADASFSVDISMSISGVEETVTVTAETPMLEIAKPSNILNVDGEFQREMPIQARRNWSDFLELTPGVNARPFDDGSGRMVYFGHATEHFAHIIQIEGMNAAAYDDSQLTYIGMGADMIEDVSVKTGGVTADEPLGTGLVMNVITKSGGNEFSGSAGLAWEEFDWNADNAVETAGASGTPTTQEVKQFDASLGGPILQDKAWFFFSYRRADLASGISRTPLDVERLQRFSGIPLGGSADTPARGTVPSFDAFPNTSKSHQPYFKFTSQLTPNHEVSAYYQRDTLDNTSDREYNWSPFFTVRTGGNLYGGKLTSIFGTDTTGQFAVSYNDKRSEDPPELQPRVNDIDLEIEIHEGFTRSGGELSGTGLLVEGGVDQALSNNPSQYLLLRGDITHYKQGFGGSHEFKTGVYAAPANRSAATTFYSNAGGDGWFYEQHVLIDPANPSLGTRPFRRERRDVASIDTLDARDRDIGIYFQDSWKPSERLTMNLGLRLDFVKRVDGVLDFTRMDSTVVGPRAGFSYLLTADARNVLRGSYGRVHEAVMGRDNVTSYTGSAGGSGGRSTLIEQFDEDGDGIFELENISPRSSGTLDPSVEFDSDLTQPYVDEFIGGYRTQLPGQLAIDAAFIHRRYTKTYALTDVNGIYPDAPFQPFIGFGLVDPNRGIIYQETNNTWSKLVYSALELTGTKQMRDFNFMAGFNWQWQHFAGDWNPTDPARFIQPDAFESDRALYMPRGNNEHNTLRNSNDLSYAPTWRRYSLRLGASWRAPGNVSVAASFTSGAGPWSGPLLDRLTSSDPEVTQYGPARISLADGSTQANPLATVYRLVGENRGRGCTDDILPDNGVYCDGQARGPSINTLGIKIGKVFSFAESQEFEVAGNIFNVLNASHHNQFTYANANRVFSPNFAEFRSLQAARGFQLTLLWRF